VTKEMSTVRKFLTVFVVTVTKEKRVARRNIKVCDKTGLSKSPRAKACLVLTFRTLELWVSIPWKAGTYVFVCHA